MSSLTAEDKIAAGRVDRRVSVRRKEDYFWLKRLADVSGEACVVVNRNMLIDFIDDKVFDLLNITPEEGERISEFSDLCLMMARQGYFGSGNPQKFQALITDLLINQRLKQRTATQLITANTPDGRHIDIRVSLGRDDGFLVLIGDKTKEELKNRALDTGLQVGKSGYWFYNLHNGEFHVRADSLKKHFKDETFEKIVRDGFTSVIHPDDRKVVDESIDQAISSGKPGATLVRVVGDDKSTIWISSHVMPSADENGKVRSLSCFFTNISEQVAIQDDLRVAQAEAERALKAKNEFLGRLSHEVRTPMNAVVGMADALVQNYKDSELKSQLSLIMNSSERVVKLVDETLEHTKLKDDAIELDPQPCSPADLIKSVCDKWQSKAAEDGTKLSCIIHPNVPNEVWLDDFRYEQCLSNLLSNALKFAKGGAVQTILTVSGSENPQLVLAVKDNGIGMEESAYERIFLPFQQANRSIASRFGGTGLGLSIVKDLTDLMDGKIKVTSQPDKGTLFAISIPAKVTQSKRPAPIAPPTSTTQAERLREELKPTIFATPKKAVEPLPEPPKAEKETPYSKLKILIVDDNETNHIVISSLLSSVVGDITTAINGQDAIDKLGEKEFDLVLMDIHMPVMDGIEATIAIRGSDADYQDVPIIALTADPQYQQARLCKNIGMNAALAKPIKLSGLLEAFDDVIINAPDKIVHTAA